ncbi:btb domain transcription factor [Holotrichia oblita]|uniref:Btb domain transcription factor n=1 Tax=Holotrichia oblita TaxID=644536 RepID=A0ACB9SQC5_HOLOL|nr:btb domain transcription factor [Holotrichia oblita]
MVVLSVPAKWSEQDERQPSPYHHVYAPQTAAAIYIADVTSQPVLVKQEYQSQSHQYSSGHFLDNNEDSVQSKSYHGDSNYPLRTKDYCEIFTKISEDPALYKCNVCEKTVTNRWHHASIHRPQYNKCPKCHQLFTRKDNMKAHMSVDLIEIYSRDRYFLVSDEKISQLFERVSGSDERKRCVLCGKIVNNTRNHYYAHFPGQFFDSDAKSYKVSQLFERVGTMDERRKCVLCGKIVSNTRNHYYVHFPGQYSCSHCPAVYTRSDTLLLHMRTKHPSELTQNYFGADVNGSPQPSYNDMFEVSTINSLLYRCKTCSKEVTNRWHHYHSHTPQRSFCPYCPATYSRIDTLRSHMRTKHQFFKHAFF